MPCLVEITETAEKELNALNLPPLVRAKAISAIHSNLSTCLTRAIGPQVLADPLRLYSHTVAIVDPSNAFIHSVTCLVNDCKNLRRVYRITHREDHPPADI